MVDEALIALMDGMLGLMQSKNGVGLAAPQVGSEASVFVVDISRHDDGEDILEDESFLSYGGPFYIINPQIVWKSGEMVLGEEGCLSIPAQNVMVLRHERIMLKYLNVEGRESELNARGLLARCIQHEYDHLKGVLIWDHLSQLKRSFAKNKALKIKRGIKTGAFNLR